MKRNLRLLSAALVIALAPVAQAQTAGEVETQVTSLDSTSASKGQVQVATRIASSFASLAGSQDNSLALVNALRDGTPATLVTPADTTTGTGTAAGTGATTGTATTSTNTTITPPTGKMGWGGVFIALALAKSELGSLGVTNPTADQLDAALTGGTITKADGTTVTVKGVLEMRADGMGWGQIAKAEGTKLGPVVSSIKSARVKMASLPATAGTTPATATTSSKATSAKGITTASGTSTGVDHSGKGHKGIVTASGSTSTVGSGHASKGITTASGAASASSSHGIMTAEGSIGSAGPGHASGSGRGLVTAAGSAAGVGVTTAQGTGHAENGSAHGRGKGGG
jgi:hypothetical protein